MKMLPQSLGGINPCALKTMPLTYGLSTWLAADLFNWQPGDIVDQLLLGLHVRLHTRSIVRIHVSRFQLLLHLLLWAASDVLFWP